MKRSIIVLACWLTLAICLVGYRSSHKKDVVRAAVPSPAGYHKAGARGRLGHWGVEPGTEEIRWEGVSDYPQWTLHGVLAPQRAPPEERLRLRHCKQTDLSNLSFWQSEHVAPVHRRLSDQTLWMHDSGVQVSLCTATFVLCISGRTLTSVRVEFSPQSLVWNCSHESHFHGTSCLSTHCCLGLFQQYQMNKESLLKAKYSIKCNIITKKVQHAKLFSSRCKQCPGTLSPLTKVVFTLQTTV